MSAASRVGFAACRPLTPTRMQRCSRTASTTQCTFAFVNGVRSPRPNSSRHPAPALGPSNRADCVYADLMARGLSISGFGLGLLLSILQLGGVKLPHWLLWTGGVVAVLLVVAGLLDVGAERRRDRGKPKPPTERADEGLQT